MTIKADKRDDGYVMIAVGNDGTIEEPQEGRIHKTRKSVYADASRMYADRCWDYNPTLSSEDAKKMVAAREKKKKRK